MGMIFNGNDGFDLKTVKRKKLGRDTNDRSYSIKRVRTVMMLFLIFTRRSAVQIMFIFSRGLSPVVPPETVKQFLHNRPKPWMTLNILLGISFGIPTNSRLLMIFFLRFFQ